MLEGLKYFLCFLRVVFGDAVKQRLHDILLVSALIKLCNVDPVVSTLTRGIFEAQNTLIHHPVQIEDDGCPGDGCARRQIK